MGNEEKQLAAVIELLKAFSASITDNDALADLAVVIAGFQTMRPYVSVGLKVCPSHETLEAMHRLHDLGLLTQQLWKTLINAVELARNCNVSSPVQQALRKPCRPIPSRPFKRSIALGTNRMNRLA